MSHSTEDKKQRKKALNKKNRLHQEIFQLMRLRRADDERVKGLEAAKKPKPSGKQADTEWGDKVASIRNRLTGQKRVSRERWNRFAGTSDGGGRGL